MSQPKNPLEGASAALAQGARDVAQASPPVAAATKNLQNFESPITSGAAPAPETAKQPEAASKVAVKTPEAAPVQEAKTEIKSLEGLGKSKGDERPQEKTHDKAASITDTKAAQPEKNMVAEKAQSPAIDLLKPRSKEQRAMSKAQNPVFANHGKERSRNPQSKLLAFAAKESKFSLVSSAPTQERQLAA